MKRANWVALDGLRGLSILFVVLVHLWAHASPAGNGLPVGWKIGERIIDVTWIFATGHNAVVTFFVLSGFLLYRHWLERQGDETLRAQAVRFYLKRARRILPAFLFFVSVYFGLAALLGKHRFAADLAPTNVLLNLTFLSPMSAAASSLDIVPGTWSLNAEIWFYLIMPALAYLLRGLPAKWGILIVLSALSPMYRLALGPDPGFIARFSLPGVADAFLLGMAVAALSASGRISRVAGLMFPVGAAWYVAICASAVPGPLDSAFQLAAASAFMIAGLIAPGDWPWKRWLSSSVIVHIGHISFSMFLINIMVAWYIVLPLSEAIGIESTEARFAMNLLVGFPLIYLFSWAGYRFIETPFLSRNSSARAGTIYRALIVASTAVIASAAPSAVAYALRDGMGVEYDGPLPQFARAVAPASMVGSRLRALPINGNPILDSETKHAAVEIKRSNSNEIQISSSGVKTGDGWIAIMLPVATQTIERGRPVYMKATLTSEQPATIETCLGIFNGKEDACSERVSLAGTRSLEVESLVSQDGLLQFKLNLFPGANGKPFDLRLQHVRVYQEKI